MLEIGGFTPLSTTDWPGQLAAVVFVQGCPWRCHYCHNVDLQPRGLGRPDGWTLALSTLRRRQGLLDGVVFSGGEPTLDPGLPDAIRAVRGLGFRVGLHTAGVYPDRLQEVLPLLDWVGFDLKTCFSAYERVTAIPRSGLPAWRSLQALLQAREQGGLSLELRTTWHPALHDDEHMMTLAADLSRLGVSDWVVQLFRPSQAGHATLAASWRPPSTGLLQGVRQQGVRVQIR